MASGIQTQGGPASISGARALGIAEADAEQAYGDLSSFQIRVRLADDGWHVDYELNDPRLQGGGPHYVIDPSDGTITHKRYEQ
jgi:hypothetical protein